MSECETGRVTTGGQSWDWSQVTREVDYQLMGLMGGGGSGNMYYRSFLVGCHTALVTGNQNRIYDTCHSGGEIETQLHHALLDWILVTPVTGAGVGNQQEKVCM